MKLQIVGKFRGVVDKRVPHPDVDAGQGDALADRLNQKTVTDALGRGVRPSADASLRNHAEHGLGHGVCVKGPDRVIGAGTGLGAPDAMRLIEKLDEGVGNGDRARNVAQARY